MRRREYELQRVRLGIASLVALKKPRALSSQALRTELSKA